MTVLFWGDRGDVRVDTLWQDEQRALNRQLINKFGVQNKGFHIVKRFVIGEAVGTLEHDKNCIRPQRSLERKDILNRCIQGYLCIWGTERLQSRRHK